MNIEQKIQQFGLGSREAKIYVTLLTLGQGSILDISRRTNFKRTTLYPYVQSLLEQGLLQEVFEGGKKSYRAADPSIFQKRIENQTHLLDDVLSELRSLEPSSDADFPRVQYFEGKKGLRRVYEYLLEQREDYDVVASGDYFFSLDEKYFKDFVENRRPSFGIHTRLLMPMGTWAAWQKKREKEQLVQVRFLPKEIGISENVIITPSFLVLDTQSAGEHAVALLIRHVGLVRSFQQMFTFMWAVAKKTS
jgi:sugar-specific transcriptional regulator TrmB